MPETLKTMIENLLKLYPEIEPYETGFLNVSDQHSLYYERCGNPAGIPIVMLHGGPGGCILDFIRQFFNPDVYNVTLFDQRGCGKSTPFACTENNETSDLVGDIEKLRHHLDIEKWAVFGYSWGSTLAMAYTTQHPDKVTGVVMGGIFLGRPDEIKNFLQPDGSGAAFFPDAYKDYLSPLKEDEKQDPFRSYINIFRSGEPNDIKRHDACFRQWHAWETVLTRMEYPLSPETIADIDRDVEKGTAKSIALLETHYIGQECFIHAEDILNKLGHLGHIPCSIYQGRTDNVCPPQTAYDVHRAWVGSTLDIVPQGPHRMRTPVMTDATVKALNNMAHTLRRD